MDYGIMEARVLQNISEIDWLALSNQKNDGQQIAEAATGAEIAELNRKIDNLVAVMADGLSSKALLASLADFEAKRDALEAQLEASKSKAARDEAEARRNTEAMEARQKFLGMAGHDRMALKLMLDAVISKLYLERGNYLVLFKNGGATFISESSKNDYAAFVAKDGKEKDFGFSNMLPKGTLPKLKKWEPAVFA
jgi:heme oxygenase